MAEAEEGMRRGSCSFISSIKQVVEEAPFWLATLFSTGGICVIYAAWITGTFFVGQIEQAYDYEGSIDAKFLVVAFLLVILTLGDFALFVCGCFILVLGIVCFVRLIHKSIVVRMKLSSAVVHPQQESSSAVFDDR